MTLRPTRDDPRAPEPANGSVSGVTQDAAAATEAGTAGTTTAQAPKAAANPAHAANPTNATHAAPVLAAKAIGSWADDLWQRLTATPKLRRRTEWIILGAVTLVAVLIRFIRLDAPGKLVFDEVYYVLDGWTITDKGYEVNWPDEKAGVWESGNYNGFQDDPEYVVHPPLGKYLIGIFLHLFGPQHVWSWRFATALFGAAAVPLLYFVGKKLLGSIALAAIAAGMLAIDGQAIVMSRTGILDIFVMFFVLLGFLFLLYDRDQQRRQLTAWMAQWRRDAHAEDASIPLENVPSKWSLTIDPPKTRPTGPAWGPVLWRRPWFVAMALSLALAISVKWSGLYFLALFCLFAVALDAYERKRAGVTLWMSAAVLRQGPILFVLAIPLTIAVYLGSFLGWFITGEGYNGIVATGDWQGGNFVQWTAKSLEHFIAYQKQVYDFHSRLAAGHPYNSSPLEWPFLIRPTAFQYNYSDPSNDPTCNAAQCVQAVTSLANPLLYWFGTFAIVLLLMFLLVRRRFASIAILVGYAAGYLPWLITGRTSVYNFYVIVWLPFMFLAAAVALRIIAGAPEDRRRPRTIVITAIAIFFGLALLVTAWFYPVWTGVKIPTWYFESTHWLPGWR